MPRVARLAALLLWLAVLVSGTAAFAAETPATDKVGDRVQDLIAAFPSGMTPEQLDAVLAVMDDQQVREALRTTLGGEMQRRSAEAAAAAEESPLDFYARRFRELSSARGRVPEAIAAVFAKPRGIDAPLDPVLVAGHIGLAIGVGTVALLLTGRLLRGRRRALEAHGRAPGLFWRMLGRLVLDLVPAVAFLLAIIGCYIVMHPEHPAAPIILVELLHFFALFFVTMVVLRLLCDPWHHDLRVIPLGDPAARAVYRTALVSVFLMGLSSFIARTLSGLGVPRDEVTAVAMPFSILPFAYLGYAAWAHHEAITAGIATQLRLSGRGRSLVAGWPILATLFLAGLWLLLAQAAMHNEPNIGPRAQLSILVATLVPTLGLLIRPALERFFGVLPADMVGAAAQGPEAPLPTTDEFGDALPASPPPPTFDRQASAIAHVERLMTVVWAALFGGGLAAIAVLWDIGTASDGFFAVAFRAALDIGLVILIGVVAWALMERWIDGMLDRARDDTEATRAQRMQTLLPLLRKVLQIALLAIIGMMILSALGVQIGPLLAGAGVVGIAIGLGAQQTINDILSGVFFLLEDAFRLGDYVEVGNIRGTVEGISLRSLKLRHQRGAVHTLPFGKIPSLTNQTRDWALMRLEFRVATDTDLDLVKKIIKDIGKQLAADPELAPGFIDPLKSQGVRNIEDNALIIAAKFIARPGAQFVIRREAYRRIRDAFQRSGVQLVGREVVVRVDGEEPRPRAAAAGGAAAVLDAQAAQ
ncbi:MAG: mechanosensitive ion channel family protein [Geminicoccaceae bacterium]